MDTKEKIKLVREWEIAYSALDTELGVILRIFKASPECIISDRIHKMQEVSTKILSKLIDDRAEWLQWYALENEFGMKNFHAIVGGKKIRVPLIGGAAAIVKVIEKHNALMDEEESKLPPS